MKQFLVVVAAVLVGNFAYGFAKGMIPGAK